MATIDKMQRTMRKDSTTNLPTSRDIAELVAFLPRLYADGLSPFKVGGGGSALEDGTLTTPWPEYDEIVLQFIQTASRTCWSAFDYRPETAYRMLQDEERVRTADLTQIKWMLTYCVRGERFSDGHWGAMIEKGHVRRLLERLAELGAEGL